MPNTICIVQIDRATAFKLLSLTDPSFEALRTRLKRHITKWLPTVESPAVTIPVSIEEFRECKRVVPDLRAQGA